MLFKNIKCSLLCFLSITIIIITIIIVIIISNIVPPTPNTIIAPAVPDRSVVPDRLTAVSDAIYIGTKKRRSEEKAIIVQTCKHNYILCINLKPQHLSPIAPFLISFSLL